MGKGRLSGGAGWEIERRGCGRWLVEEGVEHGRVGVWLGGELATLLEKDSTN
jgi:hypothetical protein